MSILVKNCMSFWRENSNVVEISRKYLNFKNISPLKTTTQRHLDLPCLKAPRSFQFLWLSLSRRIQMPRQTIHTVWQFQDFCITEILRTVWKNAKFSLTEIFSREISSLVASLVKTLLSRDFCQKSVRENSRNFHTVNLELKRNLIS